MKLNRIVPLCLLAMLPFRTVAIAQETREEAQKQQREEKQQTVTPYEPNLLERALKAVETGGIPLITRDGIYAKLGSITTGSGFAYGAGYRSRRLFGSDAALDVWGGASLKGYRAGEARVRFPNLGGGRFLAEGYGRRSEYPQEDYFGLGPDSLRSAQADFQLRAHTIGARAAMRVAPVVSIGGGLEYYEPRVSDGTDKALVSIGEQYRRGIGSRTLRAAELPSYHRVRRDRLAAAAERTQGRLVPRRAQSLRRSRSLGVSFTRLDVDLRQYVSFLSERRVLMGRVAASTSDTASGQQMPFYLMPTLGGNDSLRGYRDYRFRGPHALLLQAEYRFEIWSGLDAAFFYDAGKVAMRRADLDLNDLESDYGVGFRFNTDNGIVLRVDAAFGSRDGNHLWIVFGGKF